MKYEIKYREFLNSQILQMEKILKLTYHATYMDVKFLREDYNPRTDLVRSKRKIISEEIIFRKKRKDYCRHLLDLKSEFSNSKRNRSEERGL